MPQTDETICSLITICVYRCMNIMFFVLWNVTNRITECMLLHDKIRLFTSQKHTFCGCHRYLLHITLKKFLRNSSLVTFTLNILYVKVLQRDELRFELITQIPCKPCVMSWNLNSSHRKCLDHRRLCYDVTSDEFLKNFLQLLHCLFPNLVDFKESFPWLKLTSVKLITVIGCQYFIFDTHIFPSNNFMYKR